MVHLASRGRFGVAHRMHNALDPGGFLDYAALLEGF